LEPRWALAAQPFSHHMRDLKSVLAPQPLYTLVVDPRGLVEQSIDAAIAIARVLSGQAVDARHN